MLIDAGCTALYADEQSKLCRYCTEVHRLFTQRTQIIAVFNAPVSIAIFQSFWMNEGEWANFAPKNWLLWQYPSRNLKMKVTSLIYNQILVPSTW